MGGAGAPLSAAWPLGYSHLSLGLQQTDSLETTLKTCPKASCFTMRKTSADERRVGVNPTLPRAEILPCSLLRQPPT